MPLYHLLQGIEICAAIGDLITFACALALLLSPVASVTYSLIIGNLMIASQVGTYTDAICCNPRNPKPHLQMISLTQGWEDRAPQFSLLHAMQRECAVN